MGFLQELRYKLQKELDKTNQEINDISAKRVENVLKAQERIEENKKRKEEKKRAKKEAKENKKNNK